MCEGSIFQFSILMMNMYTYTSIVSINEIHRVAVLVIGTKHFLKFCRREISEFMDDTKGREFQSQR